MRVKTEDLVGDALDWAVARAQGEVGDDIDDFVLRTRGEYAYSTDWGLAGPIIEREQIILGPLSWGDKAEWSAKVLRPANAAPLPWSISSKPLIAAMRAHVASKFGDGVDVPDELAGEE